MLLDPWPPKCRECGKFLPWERSVIEYKSDGFPCPSPIEVQVGVCERCEKADPPSPTALENADG